MPGRFGWMANWWATARLGGGRVMETGPPLQVLSNPTHAPAASSPPRSPRRAAHGLRTHAMASRKQADPVGAGPLPQWPA